MQVGFWCWEAKVKNAEKTSLAVLGLSVGILVAGPLLYRAFFGAGAIFHMAMTGGKLPPPPPRPPGVLRNLPLWQNLDQEIQEMEKAWPGYFREWMRTNSLPTDKSR